MQSRGFLFYNIIPACQFVSSKLILLRLLDSQIGKRCAVLLLVAWLSLGEEKMLGWSLSAMQKN